MEKKRAAASEVFTNQYIQQQASSDVLVDKMSSEEAAVPEMQKTRASFGAGTPTPKIPMSFNRVKTSEELQLEKEPLKVRETGVLFWKYVIVPPNAYVVHTRTGRKEPVTLGLGVSFHYNPYTDAYLVVPAAMQTIGVVANCITKEKQGINILAYVQWQIDDFAVAYRKLDFSDLRDPLGIVNAQLGEQAEAAIKDKISTMSVEEVLTDKAPIIEELTTRLKAVAEGRNQAGAVKGEGLGIKIITVQIREAIVSSQRLWQDLQSPFRHQQARMARVSELTMQTEIRQKELETRQANEIREAETQVAIERIKQTKATEAAELRISEELTRFDKEQEAARQKIQHEEQTTVVKQQSQQRLQQQAAEMEQARELGALRRAQEKALEQEKLQVEGVESKRVLQQKEYELQTQIADDRVALQRKEHTAQLELEQDANRAKIEMQRQELEIARGQQEIRNSMNERDLMRQLIERLPELAAQMPEIHELKVLQSGNGCAFDALTAFVAQALAAAESLGIQWRQAKSASAVVHPESDEHEEMDSVR